MGVGETVFNSRSTILAGIWELVKHHSTAASLSWRVELVKLNSTTASLSWQVYESWWNIIQQPVHSFGRYMRVGETVFNSRSILLASIWELVKHHSTAASFYWQVYESWWNIIQQPVHSFWQVYESWWNIIQQPLHSLGRYMRVGETLFNSRSTLLAGIWELVKHYSTAVPLSWQAYESWWNIIQQPFHSLGRYMRVGETLFNSRSTLLAGIWELVKHYSTAVPLSWQVYESWWNIIQQPFHSLGRYMRVGETLFNSRSTLLAGIWELVKHYSIAAPLSWQAYESWWNIIEQPFHSLGRHMRVGETLLNSRSTLLAGIWELVKHYWTAVPLSWQVYESWWNFIQRPLPTPLAGIWELAKHHSIAAPLPWQVYESWWNIIQQPLHSLGGYMRVGETLLNSRSTLLEGIWGLVKHQSTAASLSWQVGPMIHIHYSDVIMSSMASQMMSLASVYSTIYSGADQRKY